jgi:hypothetical protein
MLRLGAYGAAGAIISTAASSSVLPSLVLPATPDPLAPLAPPPAQVLTPSAPGGIDPQLFAKAKAALDAHRVYPRDSIGVVDFNRPSSEERFYVVNLLSGEVESHRVAHGRGSDPDHSGFVERFSNDFGSYASSNGAYVTGEYYPGHYGRAMRVRGLDPSNSNAESRAIVVHSAWYAEPQVAAMQGRLGRSEGCFAFSYQSLQEVLARLGPGRFLYADRA